MGKTWKFTAGRKNSLKRAQKIHAEMVELGKPAYYRKHGK